MPKAKKRIKTDLTTLRIIGRFQEAAERYGQDLEYPSQMNSGEELQKRRQLLVNRIERIRKTKFDKALLKAVYTEVERLVTLDPAKNSRDGYYLTKLSTLVSRVEKKHFKFGKEG